MKTIIAITLLGLAACAPIQRYKFNYFENQTEPYTPGDVLTYNIYENEWRYTAPSAQPRFNYYENKWEYATRTD